MHRYQAAVVLAVVVLCALLGGCESQSSKQIPLRPGSEGRLSDVAVPAGFKPEAERSWLYADEQLRLAHLRYQGSPSLDQAMEFFLNQMPVGNWKLSHQSENFGMVSLVFVKGPELCTITMYRDWGKTHMTLDLTKQAR